MSGWGLASQNLTGGAGISLKCVLGKSDTLGPHCVTPVLQGVGAGEQGEQLHSGLSLQTLIFPALSVHFKGVVLPNGPPGPGRVGTVRLTFGYC